MSKISYTGSTIKTFQLKNQYKPSCKSEFPFCCYCCCCWHYLHRMFSFSVSFYFHYNIWKLMECFEFMHHSFLVNNTCVCCIYAYSFSAIINPKVTKKAEITMANIIYQNNKSNIYDKRIMNKLQHWIS